MSPVDSDEEDLTRKQRREQAREQRKALEEEEASRAVRRTRLTQLAVAVTIVVVAVVVIAIVAGGGSSKSPPKSGSSAETKAVAAVNSTVGGGGSAPIAQNRSVLGNPNAPVTLVYFGDLQCPICKDFTLGALPSIIQQWVRTGKLKIEYRSLETATREPEVFSKQQVAALAAGAQRKMWNYLELFYHEQGEENSGYVTEAYLQALARQAGLNMSKWNADRANPVYANQVAADAQAANNQGFNGTPSFLIGKTGGALKKLEYTSLTDPTAFNQAIESLQHG